VANKKVAKSCTAQIMGSILFFN